MLIHPGSVLDIDKRMVNRPRCLVPKDLVKCRVRITLPWKNAKIVTEIRQVGNSGYFHLPEQLRNYNEPVQTITVEVLG